MKQTKKSDISKNKISVKIMREAMISNLQNMKQTKKSDISKNKISVKIRREAMISNLRAMISHENIWKTKEKDSLNKV